MAEKKTVKSENKTTNTAKTKKLDIKEQKEQKSAKKKNTTDKKITKKENSSSNASANEIKKTSKKVKKPVNTSKSSTLEEKKDNSKFAKKREESKSTTENINQKTRNEYNLIYIFSILGILVILGMFLVWNFAVPENYRLSTVVEKARTGKLFIQADKFVSDQDNDVAIIEPCDLAIKYNKSYIPNLNISTDSNYGIYTEAFNEIFNEKEITVYEFSLVQQTEDTEKVLVMACLDADKDKFLTGNDLDKIKEALSDNSLEGQFVEVDRNLENLFGFNDPSKRYLKDELFYGIEVQSPDPSQEVAIKNSFVGVDNNLVFLAQRNNPDQIEIQINSLNESEPSFVTQDKIDEYAKLKSEVDQRVVEEIKDIGINNKSDWKIEMEIENFGDLSFNLNKNYAPKTVENFLLLVNRDYFDETIIHRIVKTDSFAVIQGGDKENSNSTGGQSAYFINQEHPRNIKDELWLVEPSFSTNPETGENTSDVEPEFRAPELYKDFDNQTGLATYPKGSIAMAKTSQPNSASSQFFIMLKDTELPAQYTIFGILDEEDFSILDTISQTVDPLDQDGNVAASGDGTPSQELKINRVEIID